ncbi:alpha/beta hydrolase [Kitasatospora sp. NPDC059463]|uniref:alpha/beta hydrolase n=1 Tax=unclassified Kitasatospora TaxID=2633591 RepID=UPI0036BC06DC
MITRFSRRALPAVAAAALLAACTSSGGSTDAAPGTPSTAATTTPSPTDPASATAAPAPTPTPTATPTPTVKPTGQADPALQAFYGQQLSWAACADDPKTAKIDESAVQCTTLKVPLDYADPGAGTLDVAVVRKPAAKPDQRIGAVVVNPGGPGGTGVGFVQRNPDYFQKGVRERFDTVGIDPRGVGGTSPVNCLDDRTRDDWLGTDDPGPEHGKVLADACQAKYGKLLPFLGTRDSVRDMDVLRAALGEQKLTYFGLSYGTYIGSVYAEEFPDRVGRLVLDGAVDPSLPLAQHNIEQYAGFERSLNAFAAYCAKKSSCPLGKDPDKAAGKLADFLDGLKQKPLTTSTGRVLTSTLAWTGVIEGLYGDESAWDQLRTVLTQAMTNGKGDLLLGYADSYNRRDKDGHYNVSADAYTAIHCADGATDVPTGDALQAAYADLAAKAPLISRHDPSGAVFDPDCRTWPFRSAERSHPIASKAQAPIVVVGSTGDAATPYANAEKLAAQLGNAVLLTREGEGHTGYGWSACIRTAVDAFLLEGAAPAAGTRCASDPAQ